MMGYVLWFQTYEHRRGLRFKVGLPRVASFASRADAEARLALLARHAAPDAKERRYGMPPTSYDWMLWHAAREGVAEVPVAMGSTKQLVVEHLTTMAS